MTYTYKDFQTSKIHKTSGKFEGWTDKTGLLNVKYAIFRRPNSSLFIPEYCLTKETRQKIDQKSNTLSIAAKTVCQQIIVDKVEVVK